MPEVDMASSSHSLPETYAELDTDQFAVTVSVDPSERRPAGDQSSVGDVTTDFPPQLSDSGLDHNEVVEIVGFEYDIIHTIESDEDLDNYTQRPATFSVQGVFGANLVRTDIVNAVGESRDFQGSDSDGSFASTGLSGYSQDDQGVFDTFAYASDVQFHKDAELLETVADTADSYAGGAGRGDYHSRLIYPVDMGLRGPVLDENDDLSAGFHINTEDIGRRVEVEMVGQLFYNVMEIEGVRSDFSMP